MSEARFHKLCSLEIEGGFLDGQKFNFSNGLNCMIGGRGTGKTTVLEFIRYAMDELPTDSLMRIVSLIRHNLDGGRIKLNVETKNGLSYTITRSGDSDPIVTDADNQPIGITLKDGGLFHINIFSQNEIEDIADQASSQLHLIDRFREDEILQIEHEIDSLICELNDHSSAVVPLIKEINELKESLRQIPSVKEKLKDFGREGGADAELLNEAHNQKALRDREMRSLGESGEFILSIRHKLENMEKEIDSRIPLIFTSDILSGPNAEKLCQIQESFIHHMNETKVLMKQTYDRLSSFLEDLKGGDTDLKALHDQQEIQFQQLVGGRKDIQAAASKRAKLERHHNDLLVMEKVEKELSRELESLISEREKMLEKLSDLRDKRYFIRKETAEKISKEFYPNIRATVIQGAGTELYHASLEHFLKPCGVRLETVVKKLVDAFPPESLIDIVRKNDQRALIEIGGLNESQAAKIMGALSEPDIQCKLEIVELRDEPKIELNDNEHYKETTALSTGQKCTVILPILLLDSENPLLIDQPEDNLDNRFIFETIVEKVKEIKSHRQLFFVTHNPNIPALGDAERIFVMESDGANAKKIREGNVDDCKSDIITLLEGGEEAFRERQRRYSS